MPAGTSANGHRPVIGRRRHLGAILGAALALSGCGAPVPSAPAGGDRCIEVFGDAVGLAWSQTGRYLAVGSIDDSGGYGAQVIDTEGGDPSLAYLEPEMLPETVAVSADGQLAWLSEGPAARQLNQNGPAGPEFLGPLPETITGLGWTAIGHAVLDHPPEGGSRILILDIQRPGDANLIYRTNLHVERFWISADPETMALTIGHPDHRDAPRSFEVVGADATQHLEPPGADSSGASMPSLRHWLVYRNAATSRIEAIRVADPGVRVTLVDAPAKRGVISDPGVLAYVPLEPADQVCLVDVSAKLA